MSKKSFEEIVEIFQKKPNYMNMGAGKLSKRWKCAKDIIYQARSLVRSGAGLSKKRFPKILIFDIETAPIKAAVWRIWNTDVNLNQIESDWFCLTWSAKWLYSNNIMSDKLTVKEVLHEDDNRLMRSIWKLVDEADIVIAHNAKRFDVPRLNTRFIINNIQPPSSFRILDTLIEAKKAFAFTSNKLDYINKSLGLTQKMDTGGVELWTQCLQGNPEALLKMEKYNQQDVEILEETYLKLRPWIKSHPNVGVYMEKDDPVCSSCGEESLTHTGKYFFSNTAKYPIYRCKCGAESRGRRTTYDKNRKKLLLTSVPR